jgi:uncharacterized protein with GYD domain
MPTYLAQGRFTRDAVKGMMERPENRTEAVGRLFESLGGKLVSWHLTSGEYDWLIIAEAPSHDVVVQAAIAASGGGGVHDIKTCAIWDGPAAKELFQKAGGVARQFKSAGQAG